MEYDRDPDEVYETAVETGRLPRNDALKLIVLERLLDGLAVGDVVTKSELDDRIGDRLSDHPLVRRELVNLGYLAYDNLTNEYEVRRRSLPEAEIRETPRLRRHAADISLFE
ncbi:MAG: DUF2087 domain-containing protein [Halobaculum sp.]